MVRRLFFAKNSFAQATLLLGATSLLSRLLGLVRDRLFASTFGAGNDLDAYYAAFRIPDLVFNLLILGAISAAFIPVFTELTTKRRHKEAADLTSSLLLTAAISLSIVVALMWIFAPELTTIIAPGFFGAKRALTIDLTRIMLFSPILFGLSAIAGGVLNATNRFAAYALAPVLYNIGIIFGVLVLVPMYGVRGVAYGVVLGAFFHMLIQWIGLRGTEIRLRPVIKTSKAFRRVFMLMWPRTLALGILQISLLVETVIASTLNVGSVAVINLANNLQAVASSIVGISIATAIFPILATHASRGDKESLLRDFSLALRQILYVTVPLSLFIILLRAQIVRVILGTGQFSWQDTQLTAAALGVFALSIFAQSAVQLLLRVYYAIQNTRTPLYISSAVLVIHVAAAIPMAYYFGVVGLAAAFSIESFAFLLLLLWGLQQKLNFIGITGVRLSLLRTFIATVVAGLVLWGTLHVVAHTVDMTRTWGIAVQGLSGAIVGGLAFIAVGWLLRSEEQRTIVEWIGRRL
jgi:putative peptidoglycan lipid II flippase